MPKIGVCWDESESALHNARKHLPQLAEAFFRKGRKAARAGSPVSELHQFRLEAKALRYTLEFFRPAYGPGLERRIAGLRRMQDCLGSMHDCAVTLNLVHARLPEASPEVQRIHESLDRRSRRMAAFFRRYWRTTFDRPGEERLWLAYLKRPRAPIETKR